MLNATAFTPSGTPCCCCESNWAGWQAVGRSDSWNSVQRNRRARRYSPAAQFRQCRLGHGLNVTAAAPFMSVSSLRRWTAALRCPPHCRFCAGSVRAPLTALAALSDYHADSNNHDSHLAGRHCKSGGPSEVVWGIREARRRQSRPAHGVCSSRRIRHPLEVSLSRVVSLNGHRYYVSRTTVSTRKISIAISGKGPIIRLIPACRLSLSSWFGPDYAGSRLKIGLNVTDAVLKADE